jgi:hypothetical protein
LEEERSTKSRREKKYEKGEEEKQEKGGKDKVLRAEGGEVGEMGGGQRRGEMRRTKSRMRSGIKGKKEKKKY